MPRGIKTVAEEILHRRGTTLVWHLRLAPGESTTWHRDSCLRVSVILSGDALGIEFRDGNPSHHIKVAPGQVDWANRPIASIAQSMSAS